MRTLLVDGLKAVNVGSVETANSGNRALDLMAKNRFDLIITDLEMENDNGIELIERMQKGRYIEDPLVAVIVLSANTIQSMFLSTRDVGTIEFFANPVSAKALYNRISAIIKAPRDFICTDDYFGRGRGRKRNMSYKGPERRRDKR